MFEIIALLFIIPWYFKSAKSIGKNPWLWSFLAIIIYYIPAMLWGLFVIPLVISLVDFDSDLIAKIFVVCLGISAVVFGLIFVKFFHWGYLTKSSNEYDWPNGV